MSINQPTGPGRYRVSLEGGDSGEFEARDADEAWAKFCDAFKVSTKVSPRDPRRRVELIKPAEHS